MARTHKGNKGPGYEYWSRRNVPNCEMPGRSSKTITHRIERREAKIETADIVKDVQAEEPVCMCGHPYSDHAVAFWRTRWRCEHPGCECEDYI